MLQITLKTPFWKTLTVMVTGWFVCTPQLSGGFALWLHGTEVPLPRAPFPGGVPQLSPAMVQV